MPKASDVLIECLEAEGVRFVFGIPGEETLDLNESLDRSSIEFVPVRHEQAGAFIADVCGRLTGRAGVCLGTLGPGATNLVTGVADAFLDRAPLVALTGQVDLERMHKESHQYLDVLGIMRPITKWNARVSDPAIIPEVVRKAFKVAEAEKPGATHLELPEDVMRSDCDARPLPANRSVQPGPADADVLLAAQAIRRRATADRARRQRCRAPARERCAAPVRAHHRPARGRDVHGQGPGRRRRSSVARRGRAPGRRLRDGRLRVGRPGDRGRLRPRGARPAVLEPRRRPPHRVHRLARRRDRRALRPRGGAHRRRRHHPRPPRRGVRAARRGRRVRPPAEPRRRMAHPRAARHDVPHASAADPVRAAARAGARRPADVRRRAAQAVDRPHVSRVRAEQRAHRQRARRDGLRGSCCDRREVRATGSPGRRGERRRRAS